MNLNKKTKRRIKKGPVIVLGGILILTITVFFLIPKKIMYMQNLQNYTKEEVVKYAKQNSLELNFTEEYSYEIEENKTISQSISPGVKLNKNDILNVIISIGKIDPLKLEEYKVNELGEVPIMMYHGIQNLENSETAYIGGNVDKDGYQRTKEAFQNDLEFYYNNGYRMIRLNDYIDGIVDVEIGMSPLIITFDDGLKNNIRVTGLDENGDIIIDPNSAVGILEEFKIKYPKFNVTATFFLNGDLFGQPEVNEKIIKWLNDNNYDIGNHTYGHRDITKLNEEQTQKEVGQVYNLFEQKNFKYINVVALPFGSPYVSTHNNFQSIINSKYEQKEYITKSTLRVGWESELSPFNKNFNPLFLKRIRAYDNNGKDFDIEYNFKQLEKYKYVSDGNKKTITIREKDMEKLENKFSLNVITY